MRYDKKELGLAVFSSLLIMGLTVFLIKSTDPVNGYAIKEPRIFITFIIAAISFFVFYDFFKQPKSPFYKRTYLYASSLIGIFFYVLGGTLNDSYDSNFSKFGLLFFLSLLSIAILIEISMLTRSYLFDKIKIKLQLKAAIASLILAGITFGLIVLIYVLGTDGNWKLTQNIPEIPQNFDSSVDDGSAPTDNTMPPADTTPVETTPPA
jgi:hypothetical protein